MTTVGATNSFLAGNFRSGTVNLDKSPELGSHRPQGRPTTVLLNGEDSFVLFCFFLKILLLCVWVLWLCGYHMHAWCLKSRKRHQILWNSSYKQLLTVMWVLGLQLYHLKEQSVPLIVEPFLQPLKGHGIKLPTELCLCP